jgi:ribosomal protein S18 acetylase RimI-like enzyme
VNASPAIRRELRPGDLGAIIAHHGATYLPEYDLDSTFEAHVAASVAEAGKRGFPRPSEGLWIVESNGRHAGSVAFTDEGDGIATLRWFVLDRELRGRGLGRRLIGEVIDEARDAGFEALQLETFSDLSAAAHLYRSHGFELLSADTRPRWGRPITYHRYELSFQVRAQSRNSSRAGSSERPFSVSA